MKADGKRCKRPVIIVYELCFQHKRADDEVVVKKSPISHAGNGLYADNITDNDDIIFRKGDRICQYDGENVTADVLQQRYGNNTAPYAIQLNLGLLVHVVHQHESSIIRLLVVKNGAIWFMNVANAFSVQETLLYNAVGFITKGRFKTASVVDASSGNGVADTESTYMLLACIDAWSYTIGVAEADANL